MRPALAALAEQQKLIESLKSELAFERNARKATADLQQRAISQLSRGLEFIAKAAGIENQTRTAIFKRADEQNPAEPVPDPAPEPSPTGGTVQAETPEAKADVRTPGLVPGTNNDTAADAVTTAYTPGQDIPDSALHMLDDVTRPIEGTQGPRPLSETKTLVDVRVGDPMKAQVAFPIGGPFANAQRTSSVAEDPTERTYASLRLARLRMNAGMAESDDEILESQSISKDASLSTEAIQREIQTLEKVTAAQNRRVDDDAPRNLVPRSAAVRTVPQLSKAARNASLDGDVEAEDLFLGSDL
jgi:hypothetical protein